jgi:hypothetical protein
MNLKEKYEEIVFEYLQKLENQFKVKVENVNRDIYQFSDYIIDFYDLRKIVENKISFTNFRAWYDYQLESEKTFSIDKFCQICKDGEEIKIKTLYEYSERRPKL